MGFIQNFQTFFNDKKDKILKSSKSLTQEDADYINEQLQHFKEDIFMEDIFIEMEIKKSDINVSARFINSNKIEASIKVNTNISIKGRGGRMVVRELICDIGNSNIYKSLKTNLSQDYNVSDLSDLIPNAFNKAVPYNIKDNHLLYDGYLKSIQIFDFGLIGIIIKPK